MAEIFYQDADLSVAAAIGKPVFSAPFDAVAEQYVLRQDFMGPNAIASLAFNTPHPDFPLYLLVAESERQDVGGGLVKWTRTYAKKPATFIDSGGGYNYTFIGLAGQTFQNSGFDFTNVAGREPFQKTVPLVVQRDFFVVPTDYPAFEDIPVLPAQQYYYANNSLLLATYLNDPGAQQLPAAGTIPTRTQYEALIQNGALILVEDSIVVRWMGQIFMRETRMVVAL